VCLLNLPLAAMGSVVFCGRRRERLIDICGRCCSLVTAHGIAGERRVITRRSPASWSFS